jgi:eukaryotic-like serine/threonine-protein kinase
LTSHSDHAPETPPYLERLSQLDLLLDEGLDLGPGEQQSWLERIRSADPKLAQELADLIASEAELDASGFLAPPDGAQMPVTSLAGRLIGAYTLERPLGRGGMGTVWLARRSDGRFEGQAAVKLLNLPLLDAAGAARFRREATALARLTHPNIARLTDAGIAEDSQPFLVLEYVDGVRLDHYADQQRLSVNDRLALYLQVLDAVSHAHANLIVHRDIKPSNLLVTADGTVKLLDFGIAKLLVADGAEGERSMLTDGGAALTPEYAAPEQISDAPITVATDVYSLGVLLYLLLSGRHPTGQGATRPAELLQRLLEVTPTRVSTAASRLAEGGHTALARTAADRATSPDRLRRLCRGDLDNIVARTLKKVPGERYGTVGALADDIRRYLRHEPVQARPDTIGYRTRKFVRRNRTAVAAGIVVASLLVATTGYAFFQLAEAQRQRDDARIQRDRAVFERQRSAASDNFMQSVFSTVGSSERISAAELLERARGLLEQEYGDKPALVAGLMIQLASQFHLINGIEGERRLLQRATEYASESGDPGLRAMAECALGLSLVRVSQDTAGAAVRWENGTRLLRRAARPDPGAVATCFLAEAYLRAFQGHSDAAVRSLERFDSVASLSGDSVSLTAAQHRFEAAKGWTLVGRVRLGLADLRRCDALLLRLGHSNSAFRLASLDAEYYALNLLGETREADSLNGLWLDLARRHGGDLWAFVELHAANHASWMGLTDSAVRMWRRKVARTTRDHTMKESNLFPLVLSLAAARRFDEARMAAAEYALRPDASSERIMLMRGRIAEADGKVAEARHNYHALLNSLDFPRTHGRLGVYWYYVSREARMAFADGDIGTADSLARQALILAYEHEHDDRLSAEIGRIRLLQARIALARRDSMSAAAMAGLALAPLENGLGKDRPETLEATALAARLGAR